MALFSLLIALMIERLNIVPAHWQMDQLLARYWREGVTRQWSASKRFILSIFLPALLVWLMLTAVDGVLFGGLSLVIWTLCAIFCFSHQQQRQIFRHYVQAVRRQDQQACADYMQQFDASFPTSVALPQKTGQAIDQAMGARVVWVNYRYYGAVALYFILFGPVVAIFYCTVRFFSHSQANWQADLPLADKMLFLLDWLPARLFAFGYALSGQFTQAMPRWQKVSRQLTLSARQVIIETALAAEPQPIVDRGAKKAVVEAGLVQTIAMLRLSKRNFTLFLCFLSLLTIFGIAL